MATAIVCPYCHKTMPDGIPDRAMWTCCGEVGHGVERWYDQEAADEEAAEAEAWLQHMQDKEAAK
jgi:hypothetical protein